VVWGQASRLGRALVERRRLALAALVRTELRQLNETMGELLCFFRDRSAPRESQIRDLAGEGNGAEPKEAALDGGE